MGQDRNVIGNLVLSEEMSRYWGSEHLALDDTGTSLSRCRIAPWLEEVGWMEAFQIPWNLPGCRLGVVALEKTRHSIVGGIVYHPTILIQVFLLLANLVQFFVCGGLLWGKPRDRRRDRRVVIEPIAECGE